MFLYSRRGAIDRATLVFLGNLPRLRVNLGKLSLITMEKAYLIHVN
jgi:hypothetical protein